MDQFLSWSPETDPNTAYCRAYNAPLPLPPPSAAAGSDRQPRLLACHDMMGGYLQDRLVQGGDDASFFRLWQWDALDIFIYFSHKLITIPPPGWVAAAHRNGVQVLGTFITEAWDNGRDRCERLFASRESAQAAAEQLAAIASHHGFEGWLLNIENGLGRELLPNVLHFVAHLRARLRVAVPRACVIWYDALNMDGCLGWQDGLTPLNAPFFDAADGLFVNYKWGEGSPEAAAGAAGGRASEVFMGVDVFGRGSYGGGKDNCPVALEAARRAGVSAALFAPGWVYEEFDKAGYVARQQVFWDAIRAVWPPRRVLVAGLPLATCFNSGCGRAMWLEGRCVSTCPWYNMAAQDVQPLLPQDAPSAAASMQLAEAAPGAGGVCAQVSHQLAFSGGACVALRGGLLPPGASVTRLLYGACVPLPSGGLDVSFVAACCGASRVALVLYMDGAEQAAGEQAAGPAGGVLVVLPGDAAGGPTAPATAAVLQQHGWPCAQATARSIAAASLPPLQGVAGSSTAAAASATAASAAAGTAAAGGVSSSWVRHSAQLPRKLLPGRVLTGIGALCYVAADATHAGSGAGSSGPSGKAAGGGGRVPAAAPAITAPTAGDGSFAAYIGQLCIRESLDAGSTAAVVPAPVPLSGATCTAVKWTRPLAMGASSPTQRSVMAGPATAVTAAAAAATTAVAAAAAAAGATAAAAVEVPEAEDSWEGRSSAGSEAALVTSYSLDEEEGGGSYGRGGVGDNGSGLLVELPQRLLSCELRWEAAFDDLGRPAHRCYHVWAHFSAEAGTGGAVAVRVPAGRDDGAAGGNGGGGAGVLSPTSLTVAVPPGGAGAGAVAAAAAGVAGGSGAGNGSSNWEVVHNAGEAVWLGEALVAAWRVSQLEVPAGCSSVALLVQAVAADGELQPLQLVSTLPAP